jgi:protein-S-isoprenylcysteine O-methyltransferase Ste14
VVKPLFEGSGVYGPIFIGAIALFGLQQLPALWHTLHRGSRSNGSSTDRGSFRAIQIGVLCGIVLGYLAAEHLAGATITTHRTAPFALGIAVMVVGTVLSAAAVLQLGRSFTVVVAVREGQPVVQTGVYRLLRHPSYTGQLLFFLGLALTLTNWVSIPAVLLPVVPAYAYRITVEEAALVQKLGSPYREHAARTWRLVPGIW